MSQHLQERYCGWPEGKDGMEYHTQLGSYALLAHLTCQTGHLYGPSPRECNYDDVGLGYNPLVVFRIYPSFSMAK